jgi:IS1 family transposase
MAVVLWLGWIMVDVFGAESADVIPEAHATAGVAYGRIVEILDLIPGFIGRDTSHSTQSEQRNAGTAGEAHAKGTRDAMTASAPSEFTRWLADGQRLFEVCLETLESSERLQTRTQTLEAENEMLREELGRLRHKLDMLQTERAEMVAAFNDLAGHVTQVVDHILQNSEDQETNQ